MERVLEPHDPKARLRVLREVRPRQHGARQFLVLEGTAALHELHRDLHGPPPERAAAEKVTVLRPWRPQLHEQLRELPRRERPPQRGEFLLLHRDRATKPGQDGKVLELNIPRKLHEHEARKVDEQHAHQKRGAQMRKR